MRATGQSCTIPRMSKGNWGSGGIYLRGKTWWIHYPTGSRTLRESTKTGDEAKARKVLRGKLADVYGKNGHGPQTAARVKVSELLDGLVRDYEINRKTLWWVKLNVENHLRPHFKYDIASRVGTRQIQGYVLAKRAAGLSDSTINRHLALLRRSFKLGMKHDPPKVNSIPAFDKLDESAGVRRGFLEYDAFKKLRAELPEELRPVALYAYFTGCRKGEILKLQWPQVDLGSGMVRLNPGETKNKDPRMIPLAAELRAELAGLKKQRDEFWPACPWVFSRHGKRIKSFYASWNAACKRAGVDGSLLHDMRRSGVRNLIRSGVPERVAMQISGHKTRSVFDRYNIVSEKDLGDAVKMLEKHLKGKKK